MCSTVGGAPVYMQTAPLRIALLPFTDDGSANFVVDKIPLTFRSRKQRYNWAWTDAQRLRRAMQGYLAQREFLLANLYGVDAVIEDHGINNMAALERLSPRHPPSWLAVATLPSDTLLHY